MRIVLPVVQNALTWIAEYDELCSAFKKPTVVCLDAVQNVTDSDCSTEDEGDESVRGRTSKVRGRARGLRGAGGRNVGGKRAAAPSGKEPPGKKAKNDKAAPTTRGSKAGAEVDAVNSEYVTAMAPELVAKWRAAQV